MVRRGRIDSVLPAAAGCVAAFCIAGFASSASAAVRYAGPGANGPEPCAQAAPCALTSSVNNANGNDEIVVLPGSYTLTTPLNTSFRVLNIHGLLGRAAATTISADGLPHNGSQATALGMSTGGRVSDLTLTSTQQSVNVRDMINTTGSVTVERTRISTVDTGGVVSGGTSTVVSDSVISITGNAIGISLWSAAGAQIWNDTIIATSGTSGTASGIAASAGATTAVIKNSIIRGTNTDLNPGSNPATTFTVDYSSYGRAVSGGGGGIVSAGLHNQTSQPLFLNAAADDFREAVGSPTIDAGTSGSTGNYDIAGNPRTFGPAPDIGAYEHLSAPYAATGAATSLTSAAATVAGTINPLGLTGTSWLFSYGLTTAYGSSTASVDAGSADAPSTVSVTLSGLRPYTTYHYRVLVTGPGGETDGGDNTFTTLGIAPASAAAPTLSGMPALGSTLTCSPGDWSGAPAPTLTYEWLRDASPIRGATSATYNTQPADQGHALSCAVTATNPSGKAAATSSTLRVPASTPTTPRVTGLTLTARTFTLGSKLPVVSRAPKTPVGTKIQFTLSERATVTLTFQRALPGRLVGKQCMPATAKLRNHKACPRYIRAGTYTFTDQAGPCSVHFEGMLPKRHKLAPGRYRLTVTATNAAERHSAPATTTFTLQAAPKRS